MAFTYQGMSMASQDTVVDRDNAGKPHDQQHDQNNVNEAGDGSVHRHYHREENPDNEDDDEERG